MILTPLADLTHPRRRVLLVLAGAVLTLAPACGVSGLSFKADTRVDIVAPGDRDEVRLPVTFKWTVEDFDEGSFGLLLDQAPPRPGKTLAWLYRGDRTCKGDNGKALCETDEFLASRRAYTTTDTEFTLERVPRLSGDDRRRQFHEFTVVLLDEAGRRVGEGAWSVQFEVPREP